MKVMRFMGFNFDSMRELSQLEYEACLALMELEPMDPNLHGLILQNTACSVHIGGGKLHDKFYDNYNRSFTVPDFLLTDEERHAKIKRKADTRREELRQMAGVIIVEDTKDELTPEPKKRTRKNKKGL